MNTCSTCRHWEQDPDFSNCVHRLCVRVPHDTKCDHLKAGEDPYWEEERNETIDGILSQPALVVDGSGYHAELLTRADFGCTLWEGKDG